MQRLPVDALLLLTFHAISDAATTTAPTNRTTTNANTAPMIVTGTCVEWVIPPPVSRKVLEEVGAATVTVVVELLVTSGTAHSKHRSNMVLILQMPLLKYQEKETTVE